MDGRLMLLRDYQAKVLSYPDIHDSDGQGEVNN